MKKDQKSHKGRSYQSINQLEKPTIYFIVTHNALSHLHQYSFSSYTSDTFAIGGRRQFAFFGLLQPGSIFNMQPKQRTNKQI
ncbi:hypothetical protein DOY81_004915 [Sarcophaga bullata]|nr:hypothetical protein DOY81_004915 [Sarcophaga bullata]